MPCDVDHSDPRHETTPGRTPHPRPGVSVRKPRQPLPRAGPTPAPARRFARLACPVGVEHASHLPRLRPLSRAPHAPTRVQGQDLGHPPDAASRCGPTLAHQILAAEHDLAQAHAPTLVAATCANVCRALESSLIVSRGHDRPRELFGAPGPAIRRALGLGHDSGRDDGQALLAVRLIRFRVELKQDSEDSDC